MCVHACTCVGVRVGTDEKDIEWSAAEYLYIMYNFTILLIHHQNDFALRVCVCVCVCAHTCMCVGVHVGSDEKDIE